MPHYDYICTHCQYQEEKFQKITDQPLKQCPKCQNLSFQRKPGGGGGILFQGTGFYETDYNAPKKPIDSSSSATPSSNCACKKNLCSE